MHRRLHSNQSGTRQKRGPRREFRFNLLVAGMGGCGKSTLINSLCGKHVVNPAELDADVTKMGRERSLRLRTYTDDYIDPDQRHMMLRFVETSGFGDNLDNGKSLRETLTYIESQFDEVLAEESRIRRNPRFIDNRVHVLLYLIEPTGHGLREIDVEFMRLVGHRVNVIPVLAKADALTRSEIALNKRLVREDIERYQIPVYLFEATDDPEDRDRSDAPARESVYESVPFAVISSNTSVNLKDGRSALAREYPWGTVLVDDPRASDFSLLRDVLLYSHLNELKDYTYDMLYENYRTQRLSESTGRPMYTNGSANGSSANDSGMLDGNSSHTSNTSGYLVREDQLRQEETQLHRSELNLQSELEQKRLELRRREAELQELEARLRREAEELGSPQLQG